MPKKKLVLLGLTDCLGFVLGLIAAGRIDGTILVITAQSVIPFTMIASYIILGKRYVMIDVAGN